MTNEKKPYPNPAAEAGALVAKVLNAPSMGGYGGGSLMEERAQDKHKDECVAELRRLRTYSRPPEDPELHMILDAVAKVLRV